MTKFFVLDTNVLISDPDCIWKFEDGTVIIPMIVIEELDKIKKFSDDAARNARKASKNIDELRSQGSLIEGVSINPGIVKVCSFNEKAVAKMPAEYKDFTKPDNIILAVAFELNQKIKDCVLVTKDVNMRIKGDSLGIKSEDYESDRVTDDVDSLYKGVRYIETTQEFINNFYTNRKIALTDDEVYINNYMPNEFVVYKTADGSGSAIGRFHKADHTIKEIRHFKDVFGIRAKNLEQQLALDLLFDDNIKLVTLAGSSGVGKTVLSIAAALQQTLIEGKFDKIIISRTLVSIGKDIGALPGLKVEKLAPYLAGIKDSIDFLCGNQKPKTKSKKTKDFAAPTKAWNYSDRWFEEGIIEMEAVTFMRGRSLPNCIMILDESQNTNLHEIKTVLTRIGDNSKCIILGDVFQVDSPSLNSLSNGLTHAIEKFKNQPIAGHVTMTKGERSELATISSKIL